MPASVVADIAVAALAFVVEQIAAVAVVAAAHIAAASFVVFLEMVASWRVFVSASS